MTRFVVFLLLPCLACTSGVEELPVPPACASPAPLALAKEAALPTYVVQYRRDTVDDEGTTDALAARYGFEVAARLGILTGVSAELSPSTVAALRCERAVSAITQERRMTVLH